MGNNALIGVITTLCNVTTNWVARMVSDGSIAYIRKACLFFLGSVGMNWSAEQTNGP